MSAPDRALLNLNLDEMPVTRSNTRPSREGGGRGQAHRGSNRLNPLPWPTPNAPPGYPPETSRRAPQAVQEPSFLTTPTAGVPHGSFEVERVIKNGTSVKFRLSPITLEGGAEHSTTQIQSTRSISRTARNQREQTWIQINYDVTRGNQPASCTCPASASNPICAHISWLIGRLTRVLINLSSMDITTSINIKEQIGELYPRMRSMSEARLGALTNSTGSDNPDEEEEESDDDAEAEEVSRANLTIWPSAVIESQDLSQRRNILCDILSSFDIDKTPQEFNHDVLITSRTPTSTTDCLIEDNLPETLYYLGMRDWRLFANLLEVVSPDTRADKYYETQTLRAQGALQSCLRQRFPPISVLDCAKVLRSIVNEVYTDRIGRRAQSDPSVHDRIDEKLAGFLVTLVENVVKERFSGYQRMAGNRPNQAARECNIYTFLISDRPPPDSTAPDWMKDLFVVGRFLEGVADGQWRGTRGQWQNIKTAIESHVDAQNDDAREYADKIEGLLQALNGMANPSDSAELFRMPRG